MSDRGSFGWHYPPGCSVSDIPGWDETDEADDAALDYEAQLEAALEREFREADREEE